MILNHGHVGVGVVSLLLFGIGAVGVVFLRRHCTFAKFLCSIEGWVECSLN
jgi:NADH:ubiquinone oxidoreductase subunit K